MEYNYTRNQARSLILSIVGHCAFFILGIFMTKNMSERLSHPQEPERRTSPARVEFQDPGPAQAAPFGSAETSSQSNLKEALSQDMAQPSQEETAMAQTSMPEEIQESQLTESQTAPADSSDASTDYRQTSSSAAGTPDRSQTMHDASGRTSAGSHPRPGGRRISGAQFMGAFRRSMRAEQEAAYQGGSGTGQSGGTGSGQAHVQERLKEWGQADYHGKVARALIKAAKIHKKYVRTPIDLNVKLYISLTLDKAGKVKNIDSIEKVGIDDIDQFIKEFFLVTDFPPIPSRFNVDEFSHRLTISLLLSEGGHSLQLRPMSEN